MTGVTTQEVQYRLALPPRCTSALLEKYHIPRMEQDRQGCKATDKNERIVNN